nr:hypothetical protein [Tanacetum cinerariifolium]
MKRRTTTLCRSLTPTTDDMCLGNEFVVCCVPIRIEENDRTSDGKANELWVKLPGKVLSVIGMQYVSVSNLLSTGHFLLIQLNRALRLLLLGSTTIFDGGPVNHWRYLA